MSIVWDRTRTRSDLSTWYERNCYSQKRTGSLEHGFGSPTGYTSFKNWAGENISETTQDMINENYRRRIQDGAIINSPYYHAKTTLTYPVPLAYQYEIRDKTGYGTSCGLHTPSQVHRMIDRYEGIARPNLGSYVEIDASARAAKRQEILNLAVTQAHANIDESEMLAWATVYESGKTMESIKAILWRAYKILRNVRRLHIRELAEELSPKEVANRYMEARYAIRPLLYDMRGAVNALNKSRGHTRRTYRGFAEGRIDLSGTQTTVASGLTYLNGVWTRKSEYVVSAKAGVLCDVDVTEISVLGIDHLVESAWELVPFSFIADWFSNIGDWIAAHTPNAGVRQRASWVTVKEIYTKTRQSVSYSLSGLPSSKETYSISVPTYKVTSEELVLTREVDPAVSTFPQVQMNLDVFKITDLGIIMKNLFR